MHGRNFVFVRVCVRVYVRAYRRRALTRVNRMWWFPATRESMRPCPLFMCADGYLIIVALKHPGVPITTAPAWSSMLSGCLRASSLHSSLACFCESLHEWVWQRRDGISHLWALVFSRRTPLISSPRGSKGSVPGEKAILWRDWENWMFYLSEQMEDTQ